MKKILLVLGLSLSSCVPQECEYEVRVYNPNTGVYSIEYFYDDCNLY